MRGPHNIWRLIRTGATFERTGAMGVVLDAFDAPPHLRLAARVLGWPFKWLGLKGDVNTPPATRALTALGPAYIKFGQILSTRPDVVGDKLAEQLKVLQDKLPPFSIEVAKQSIARELGDDTDNIFSDFNPALTTTKSDPTSTTIPVTTVPGRIFSSTWLSSNNSAKFCVIYVSSPHPSP